MDIQEQAFRDYYASMSEAKLLETAAHRSSFIGVAQRLLDEEFARRNLPLPAEPARHAEESGVFAGLSQKLKGSLRRH